MRKQLTGTVYAPKMLAQVGLPAPGGAVPGVDAIRLFIVGWVGGDSGRHSPGRLLSAQAGPGLPTAVRARDALPGGKAAEGLGQRRSNPSSNERGHEHRIDN